MDRAIALARQYGTGRRSAGEHQPLDARRKLRLARRRRRRLRHVLDQHARQSAAVGRVHARRRATTRWSIAIPRPAGAHVVLDMAMSQFSYGALSALRRPRRAAARARRLQPGRRTDPRSRRHRSLQARSCYRLLEGLRPLAGPRYGRRNALRRPRHPRDSAGIHARVRRQPGVPRDRSVTFAARPRNWTASPTASSSHCAQLRPSTQPNPSAIPASRRCICARRICRLGVPVTPDVWAKLNTLSF